MQEIKPTVGRIVYYKTRGSADGVFPPTHFAALITEVDPDSDAISVCTFGPSGFRFERGITKGEEIGQWDWMPYQKDQQARFVHPLIPADVSGGPVGNNHTTTDKPNALPPSEQASQ